MKGEDKELIRIAADLRISKAQRKELTLLRIDFFSKLKSNLVQSKNEFNLWLKMDFIGGSIK